MEYVLEVEVNGKFDNSKTPMFGHLSWALNEINIKDIVSIKDVTSNAAYPKPDYKAQTAVTGEDSTLQMLNTDLMLYLSGESKEGLSKYFDDSFVLIDPTGYKFKRDELEQFRQKGLLDKAVIFKEKSVINWSYMLKYVDGNYSTYGMILWTLSNGKDKRIGFECIYHRLNDSFVLQKVSLRWFE